MKKQRSPALQATSLRIDGLRCGKGQHEMPSVCKRSQGPHPANFDGYVIDCPSCGNYEVAGGAWERFQNASKQEWAAALAKAASLKGVARWPTIKNICF